MNNNEDNYPTQEDQKRFLIINGIVFVVIAIIAIIVLRNIQMPKQKLGETSMRAAYKYATQVIEDQFSTETKFPRFKTDFVSQRSEHIMYKGKEYYVYTVTSYFDVKNIFNTKMHDEYVIKIGLPTGKNTDYYYEFVSDTAGLLTDY